MTLRVFDGFDDYTTLTDKGFFVTTGTSVTTSNPRYGTQCLRAGGSDNESRRTLGVSNATWILGVAYKPSGTSTGNILTLLDTATGNVHVRVAMVSSTMKLKVINGAGTQLGSDSSESLVLNGWNWIEFKVFIHDTLGTVEVRLHETVQISLTGQDTRNGTPSTADAVGFSGAGSGAQVADFDDFYACDDQGTTNNNYLGDIRVETIYPTGAGNYTQFTPSTGSNWQNVDDATPNSDTDYNSSGTAGNKDTFVYGNLSSTTGTIYAVKYSLNAKKDNAGAKSFTPLQRQASTDYTGTTRSLLDTYASFEEIKETNPATGVAWTVSDVNTDAEFGYEVVV